MRKRKVNDRLSRWAQEAEKRGMSYGRYSAAIFEGRIQQPEIDLDPSEGTKEEYGTCPCCGAGFRKRTAEQKVCNICRKEWARQQQKNNEMIMEDKQ